MTTVSLNDAVRIQPSCDASPSAAFRNSDMNVQPGPGRLPCRNKSRFLRARAPRRARQGRPRERARPAAVRRAGPSAGSGAAHGMPLRGLQ